LFGEPANARHELFTPQNRRDIPEFGRVLRAIHRFAIEVSAENSPKFTQIIRAASMKNALAIYRARHF
jgi:hypothetical protein